MVSSKWGTEDDIRGGDGRDVGEGTGLVGIPAADITFTNSFIHIRAKMNSKCLKIETF